MILNPNEYSQKKRLNSKIVVFPVSITKFLSDIQNTEHENSRIEVLTKDITFLQNELKSKGSQLSNYRITSNTEDFTKSLSHQIPKTFQSIENQSQQQLRQHRDHYQHHRQHQQQHPQSQTQHTLATV